MLSSKPDEITRLRSLLQEKNDKLEDLRTSLKQSLLENGRLSIQVSNQAKQLQILSSEKTESQVRFESTNLLAKKLDLKLQMASARLETASANAGLPEKLRDAEDRLSLARKKIEKQADVLQSLSQENAVLTRAIALHCRDADDAVDVVKDNASLSIQMDRMQKDLENLNKERAEVVRLSAEVDRLQDKLEREEAKSEAMTLQLKEQSRLKSELVSLERNAVSTEAKQNALKEDNIRLSESVRDLRRTIESQEALLLNVSHQLEEARSLLSLERSKRESIDKELSEARASKAVGQSAELKLKEQLEIALDNIHSQEELISRLKDEVLALTGSSTKDRGLRSNLQEELRRQRQVISDLEAQSRQHTEELLDLRAMHHQTQREVEVRDRQIQKLRSLLGQETLAKAKRLADN